MAEEYSLPPQVRDFITGFYTSVKSGRVHDIQAFYDRHWRDISKRFFTASSWPTAREIAPLVKDDRAFLVLYRLLFFKHLLTSLNSEEHQPSLAQYIEAWNAYTDFFAAARDPVMSAAWELPSMMIYDLFADLLYNFQKFQDLRLGPAHAAADEAGDDTTSSTPAAPTIADADIPKLMRSWRLADVMALLHGVVGASDIMTLLANNSTSGSAGSTTGYNFRAQSGYFALICLVRMYTKLGDYAAAIECARPLNVLAGEGLFTRVQKCHISLQYYVGFALLMSRRFEDAFRLFNRTLMQFKSLFSESNSTNPFIKRQADKMLSLLCITAAVCPGATWDEPIRRLLRDRMNEKLEHISSGSSSAEGDIKALFMEAAPGFFCFTPLPLPTDIEGMRTHIQAAEATDAIHLQLLTREVLSRTTGLATLRSYLRLYTNIDTARLADYCGTTVADVRATLMALKLKSWQTGPSPVPGGDAEDDAAATSSAASNDPLHFFMVSDTVSIQEARAPPSTNAFFIRGIETTSRIMRDTVADGSAVAAAARSSRGGRGGGRGGASRGRY